MYSIYRDLKSQAESMAAEMPNMPSWEPASGNRGMNLPESPETPSFGPPPVNGGTFLPESPETPNFGPPSGNGGTFLPESPETPNFGPPPGNGGFLPESPETPNFGPPPGNGGFLPESPETPNFGPPIGNLPTVPGRPPVTYPTPSLPGGNQGYPVNFSNLRFLYAAVKQPAVNIRIGSTNVVNNFQYGNVTPYYVEKSGIIPITLSDTRTGRVIYRGQFAFLRNIAYTLAIVNEGNGIAIFVIVDNKCPNLVGTGCLRAINLSVSAGPVDIFMNGFGRIFQSVDFKEVTPTRRITSGNYRAYVSEALPCANNNDVYFNDNYATCNNNSYAIMDRAVVNVKNGVLYTLYVIGNAYSYPALQMIAAESDLII